MCNNWSSVSVAPHTHFYVNQYYRKGAQIISMGSSMRKKVFSICSLAAATLWKMRNVEIIGVDKDSIIFYVSS